jgi:hypothetical protein
MSEAQNIFTVASEMGINVDSLDEGLDLGDESTSMEAEAEVKEDAEAAVDSEVSDEDDSEIESTEGEEEKPVEVSEEAPIEEPKQTAKEIQEIEAARVELEAKEKAITERFAIQEKEFQEKYHEKLKAHDELDSFLAEVAETDPDLFEVFKEKFQAHQKQYFNPVINELREKNNQLEQKLDTFLKKASDEVTITKLDSEMNKAKASLGKEAEAAGLKVDWQKVEDLWADNPKLSVDAAFYALYGANLTKASASKAKVEAVEKKIQARPSVSTAGSVNRSNSPKAEVVPNNAYDAVRYYAKKLTGSKA